MNAGLAAQLEQGLAVEHHLGARLAGKSGAKWATSTTRRRAPSGARGWSPPARFAPDADAVAVEPHRHRRADEGHRHRVPIAQHRHQRLGGDLAGLQQAVVGRPSPAAARPGPPRGQQLDRRHARRREGRAFACRQPVGRCAARSASSRKARPARKLPLIHLTSFSTLPFWLAAPGGTPPDGSRTRPRAGAAPASRSAAARIAAAGDRLHVVEDQHPRHPAERAEAVDEAAEERLLAHVAVKRTQTQRLYLSRQARK